jgi:hypothetical protein
MPQPAPTVDDDTALEEVMGFLANPPAPGSTEDARFGARLRQVIAASIPRDDTDDEDDAPALEVSADLRAKLDEIARRRGADHPFGDHPDGIGPTLGMDLSRS